MEKEYLEWNNYWCDFWYEIFQNVANGFLYWRSEPRQDKVPKQLRLKPIVHKEVDTEFMRNFKHTCQEFWRVSK